MHDALEIKRGRGLDHLDVPTLRTRSQNSNEWVGRKAELLEGGLLGIRWPLR